MTVKMHKVNKKIPKKERDRIFLALISLFRNLGNSG